VGRGGHSTTNVVTDRVASVTVPGAATALLPGGARADRVGCMGASGGPRDSATLRLTGDIDALTQSEYRRTAADLLGESTPRTFVVDMAAVSTIDSSGLGLLVHLHSLTREHNVDMVLTRVPPHADALLKRTGLDRVFQIEGR
jgi:anti-anti-sigma factor